MNYKVLGISSGLGVSLFTFKDRLIGNMEARRIFHTPGNEQWEANFGEIPLYKKYTPIKLKVDVIISSPDCGSGSILRYSRNKVLGDHKDNDSLRIFFLGVDQYRPKFFYFENLEALFKSFPEDEFDKLLKGYRLIKHIASVSNWGNSQKSRKRLVIIGIRKDLPTKIDRYFKLPHYNDQLKTCGQLYGDLHGECFSNGNIREHFDDVISIHAKKRMSLREIANHWRGRLHGKKRWETEPGFNFATAPGVYRNLNNSYPATARKANRQFDELGFTLSPRQLARVQGVPNDFKIYIDPNKPKYWINKGRTVVTKTPPYEISVWFKKKLQKALKHIK